LWEEVRKKWESQQQLTNQLVYLTVALAAVSWFILREGFRIDEAASSNTGTSGLLDESSLEWARRAWLVIPFLYSTLGLLIAYHDRGIRQIAAYVYEWLRPEVEALVQASAHGSSISRHVWHWDIFWYPELVQGERMRPMSPLVRVISIITNFWYSGAKYGLILVPCVGALGLWILQANEQGLWWIGFGGAATITVMAVFSGAFESLMYIRIARDVAAQHASEP
jgi:hypothetical protein